MELADLDFERLSPRARETFENIVPLVEDEKSHDEIAAHLKQETGVHITGRDVSRAMEELREELEAQVNGAQLPDLPQDEYDALKDSIREIGQQVPILVTEEGVILDGNHRARACAELNIEPLTTVVPIASEETFRAISLAVNVARRQLSVADKRRVVEAELIRYPQSSDRSIAITAGVSPTTVGKVRAELQERGKVSRFTKRVDAGGRELETERIGREPTPSAPPPTPPTVQPGQSDAAAGPPVSEEEAREIIESTREAYGEDDAAPAEVVALVDDQALLNKAAALGVVVEGDLDDDKRETLREVLAEKLALKPPALLVSVVVEHTLAARLQGEAGACGQFRLLVTDEPNVYELVEIAPCYQCSEKAA